ncbi:homoserine O-acetyltransferase [Halobaculum sp. MBLA0143]|uniref:homoserine O-acetyltransferase MetX n=1 Tax=Halobaculum sp. MBLA0143 TaxID=3079933 RepID=UPI0035237C5E
MTRRASLGPFRFENGERVPDLELAYETYGRYDGSNAVLVCHALTGSHHVRSPTDEEPDGPPSAFGWWDEVVAPGGPIDTTEQYVICVNVPGSCHGSTGPTTARLDGDGVWGSAFPTVTVGDWARAQARLLDHLGVRRLSAVVGGSVGGMNALEWARRYPERVDHVAAVAAGPRLDAEMTATNAVARRAITGDPDWQGGDYHGTGRRPTHGLAQARRLGHLSYRSKASLDDQFGREPAGRAEPTDDPTADDGTYRAVASYLDYNAERFAERFDAVSYLSLLRAMEEWDLADGAESSTAALAAFDGDLLLVSYTGDRHFPVAASEAVADAARAADVSVTHHTVESEYGHDAFLADQSTLASPLSSLFDGDDGADPPERPGRTRSASESVAPVHAGLYGP